MACGASSKPGRVEPCSPRPSPASGGASGDGGGGERKDFRAPAGCGLDRSGVERGPTSVSPNDFGVDARARCAAASPPERRSRELSGGGCNPVDEPIPLSPRLIAGLSSSASAGPIGCTSGLDALETGDLEPGAFDLVDLPGFFGFSGFFAIGRIWDKFRAAEKGKQHLPQIVPELEFRSTLLGRIARLELIEETSWQK